MVTGGPQVYNVAISGMTSDGDVTLTFTGGAHDGTGNANQAPSSGDNTVAYDTTGPTVSVDKALGQADPTNVSPINFTVTFNEDVADFDSSDLTLAGSAGATTALVTGGPQVYNVAVSGMTSDGDVTLTFTGSASDAATNTNQAPTYGDNTVAYDTTGPTVSVAKALGQADPTNASPINFTVTFNENVADFDSSDLTLAGSAGATTAVVTGGPQVYNVAVSGMTSDGDVTLTFTGSASDAATNGTRLQPMGTTPSPTTPCCPRSRSRVVGRTRPTWRSTRWRQSSPRT